MKNYIFFFNDVINKKDLKKEKLGNKGLGLAEMSALGLPVPKGLILSTDLSSYYYNNNKTLPKNFDSNLLNAIKKLEEETGRSFLSADPYKFPLLLSVRSGSAVSMPGMMDTILNLGINQNVINTIIAYNPSLKNFAYDTYKRFIELYARTILKIESHILEAEERSLRNKYNKGINEPLGDTDILEELILRFKDVLTERNLFIPEDPFEQIKQAIIAVLESWHSPRAIIYRKLNKISDDIGTAVNIQMMVFGNMGDDSATGVLFTRNPSNGTKEIFGEFLPNAQGEDVVAGIRTPFPLMTQAALEENVVSGSLDKEVFKELYEISLKLEKHYKDVQDIEFTIEKGVLYILQTRSAKRTTLAAIKIAIDMVAESLLTKQEALNRVSPESLNQLLHTRIDYSSSPIILARGLPASPGAAYGKIVFSSEEAEEAGGLQKVILVRNDTCPEDIKGMHIAQGVLTSKGGMTSHAAVVARGMGKPCVSGAHDVRIDYENRLVRIGSHTLTSQDIITIDGTTGNIILGEALVLPQELNDDFRIFMEWAEQFKRLKVYVNAETVNDIKLAMSFNAEGIGLCRTEHMFFETTRLRLLRMVIAAPSFETRMKALASLESYHKQDFINIFSLIKEMPITIRLLDPPLHEFLPSFDDEIHVLAKELEVNPHILISKLQSLKEFNPMLGHRGARLAITYPEIYEMQVNAIFKAAMEIFKETGQRINLEIMLPFISTIGEIEILTKLISNIALQNFNHYNEVVNYSLGTMIEIPRAVLISDELANYVDFFSYGTNDLTQTTYGLSRDDVGSFMHSYIEKGIFKDDPFIVIDECVGEMVKMSIEKARDTKPSIKLGICGEHGGNTQSVYFFDNIGMDYVSCSPFRIPIAKLAAAQSVLKKTKK